jgi:hypothetical protein
MQPAVCRSFFANPPAAIGNRSRIQQIHQSVEKLRLPRRALVHRRRRVSLVDGRAPDHEEMGADSAAAAAAAAKPMNRQERRASLQHKSTEKSQAAHAGR